MTGLTKDSKKDTSNTLDNKSNVEVRRKSGMKAVRSLIKSTRLCWLEHEANTKMETKTWKMQKV